MNAAPPLLAVLMMIVAASPTRAQDSQEASTAQVLESLGEQPVKKEITRRFETQLRGEPLGFSIVSLEPVAGENGGYRYRMEALLVLPNGQRVEAAARARLSNAFEPSEVEFSRRVVDGSGNAAEAVERAEISDTEVLIATSAAGGSPVQRVVARPQSPFVFGTEFIMPLVDTQRYPKFALREFNFQEGLVSTLHCTATGKPGEARELTAKDDAGEIRAVFEIDSQGNVVSWREPPMPISSKFCTQDRVEELRKLLNPS